MCLFYCFCSRNLTHIVASLAQAHTHTHPFCRAATSHWSDGVWVARVCLCGVVCATWPQLSLRCDSRPLLPPTPHPPPLLTPTPSTVQPLNCHLGPQCSGPACFCAETEANQTSECLGGGRGSGEGGEKHKNQSEKQNHGLFLFIFFISLFVCFL